jgi:L-lactate dehydrogenase complex protein LldG
MSAKDSILGRVAEALRVPTDPHARKAAPSLADARACMPPGGDTFEERLALFKSKAEALRAEFVELPEDGQLDKWVRKFAVECGWKKVGAHRAEIVEKALEGSDLPVVWTDGGYTLADLESCDAGITACDALIAQTGSVLVTSRSCGGRALSVLPPHHVVLARRDQLLPDLTAAFALLETAYGANPPSFCSFITGPSRTGDIERILVLGAHGPRRLTIVVAGM